MPSKQIIFITGTDTGVGKTVLTALLLDHCRRVGIRALAMKPFSSGDRGDAKLLQRFQGAALPLSKSNPFHFSAPLAPLVAARKERRCVSLEQVLDKIAKVTPRCDLLLVEGCGGWLVPLGQAFDLADIAEELGGQVVIAAPNRLGAINHSLLTWRALGKRRQEGAKIVLVEQEKSDQAALMNLKTLQEFISHKKVFLLPFLGSKPLETRNLENNYESVKKILQALLGDIPSSGIGSLEKRFRKK